MTFDDFMVGFRARHAADWLTGNPGMASNVQESRESIQDVSDVARKHEKVNNTLTLENEFKQIPAISGPFGRIGSLGTETHGISSLAKHGAVMDRKSQAAGDDWAEVADDTSGFAEFVD